MKSNRISILLALSVLIASTLACAFGELSLENPRMTRDAAGTQIITAYTSSDSVFNVVADLKYAPKGTIVEAKWYAVDVPGFDSGPLPTDSEIKVTVDKESFTGTVTLSLTSADGAWAVGAYKVELYLNGALAHTVNFSVQ